MGGFNAIQTLSGAALPRPPLAQESIRPASGASAALALDLSIRYGVRLEAGRFQCLSDDGAALADATRKFLCPIPQGGDGFLLLSSFGNPKLVARGVRNIESIRAVLPADLAAPVLTPAAAGEIASLTYAVWPRKQTLHRNRFVAAYQKWRLMPALYDWLFGLCRESLVAPADDGELAEGFVAPLEFMAAHSGQTEAIRAAARVSLDRLAAGAWRPRHCIQHSDFWVGNIILPSAAERRQGAPRFFVVDWAGARLKGYPLIDLVRFMQSVRARAPRRERESRRYLEALGCDRADTTGYILAALGALGANLEYFPEDRYLALSASVFDYALALRPAGED